MAFYFCDFTSSRATLPDVLGLGDQESEAADSAWDRFGRQSARRKEND